MTSVTEQRRELFTNFHERMTISTESQMNGQNFGQRTETTLYEITVFRKFGRAVSLDHFLSPKTLEEYELWTVNPEKYQEVQSRGATRRGFLPLEESWTETAQHDQQFCVNVVLANITRKYHKEATLTRFIHRRSGSDRFVGLEPDVFSFRALWQPGVCGLGNVEWLVGS